LRFTLFVKARHLSEVAIVSASRVPPIAYFLFILAKLVQAVGLAEDFEAIEPLLWKINWLFDIRNDSRGYQLG
jgi:hypothetical protein